MALGIRKTHNLTESDKFRSSFLLFCNVFWVEILLLFKYYKHFRLSSELKISHFKRDFCVQNVSSLWYRVYLSFSDLLGFISDFFVTESGQKDQFRYIWVNSYKIANTPISANTGELITIQMSQINPSREFDIFSRKFLKNVAKI